MPTNNFKLFDENRTNILTNAEYASNQQRINGVQSGIASSKLQNKSMYQNSLMSYALAQLMYQNGIDADDEAQVSTFISNLDATLLQKVLDKASYQDVVDGTLNKWVDAKNVYDYIKAQPYSNRVVWKSAYINSGSNTGNTFQIDDDFVNMLDKARAIEIEVIPDIDNFAIGSRDIFKNIEARISTNNGFTFISDYTSFVIELDGSDYTITTKKTGDVILKSVYNIGSDILKRITFVKQIPSVICTVELQEVFYDTTKKSSIETFIYYTDHSPMPTISYGNPFDFTFHGVTAGDYQMTPMTFGQFPHTISIYFYL